MAGYLKGSDIKSRSIEPFHEGISVENAYAGTLAIGTLVYVSGINTTTGKLKVSRATSAQGGARPTYIVIEAIPQSGFGRVARGARVRGVDTSGWSAAGDPVYVGTAGGFSKNANGTPIGYVQTKATSGVVVIDFRSVEGISGDLIQFVDGKLDNAEMLALRATPKTLVPAPGAGYYLEFVSLQLLFDYTGAYTETADNMAVKYGDGSGAAVSQTIEATGFVDATADTMTNALPKIDAIVAKTGCDNKALVLHNTGDGEYGGGNAANVVRYRCNYRVHAAGW